MNKELQVELQKFMLGKEITIEFDNACEFLIARFDDVQIKSVDFNNKYNTKTIIINQNININYEHISVNANNNGILNLYNDGDVFCHFNLSTNAKGDWTIVFGEEDESELDEEEKFMLIDLLNRIDCADCRYENDTFCEDGNNCVFERAIEALDDDFMDEYDSDNCNGCYECCERVKED